MGKLEEENLIDYQLEDDYRDFHQRATNQDFVDQDLALLPEDLSGDQNAKEGKVGTLKNSPKANRLLTMTAIVKTVIGSGILTIPYVMNTMGFILCIFLFFLSAILNQFGSILLLKAKNLSRHSNYSTIFYSIWPNKMAKGIGSAIIFIACAGVCTAQLILFKTTIRKLLKDIITNQQALDDFYTSKIFIVLVIALLEVPFTLVPKIQKLRFLGFIGVSGIVIFEVTFVIYYILCVMDIGIGDEPKGGMRMFPENWFMAAATVPNLLFSLSFQNNFFPFFKGLKNSSDKRMSQTSLAGVLFCLVSYTIIGLLGYNFIGDGVSPNFLESISYETFSKPFFYLLNTTFLISIFCAFPIMFFGGRNNFIAIVNLAMNKNKKDEKKRGQSLKTDSYTKIQTEEQLVQRLKIESKTKKQFIGFTVLLFLLIVGLAVGVDNIQVVFNIVGAICAASVTPLFPCMFYICLIIQKKKKKTIKFYISIVIFVIMAPYSIFSIVSLYINDE